MESRRLLSSLIAVAVVGGSALSAGCDAKPAEPAAQPSAPVAMKSDQDPVARGEYLVSIMSCQDCHTPGTFYGKPDLTRRLSGSDLGWAGPWGVVRPRNLTPDEETGIGKWSKEQIVRALRTGMSADGTMLAPIMPWMNYAGVLTEDDAMAIASYLKSLPPVKHKNLDRIPPGQKPTGTYIAIPPPPAWDAPTGPPASK